MTTDLTPTQRRDALVAALDWVGAYEGTGPDGLGATIEQGARDVPQDLLDAYVVLRDMVDQAARAYYRADFVEQAREKYTDPRLEKAIQKAATEHARTAVPDIRYERLLSTET